MKMPLLISVVSDLIPLYSAEVTCLNMLK